MARAFLAVSRIYKILASKAWERAVEIGEFRGSPVDLSDGFIHFSTADQAAETGRRYFRGQTGLVVLVVEAESLGEALRWEVSRGGALFPHLYRSLATKEVIEVRLAPLAEDGAPDLGDLSS